MQVRITQFDDIGAVCGVAEFSGDPRVTMKAAKSWAYGLITTEGPWTRTIVREVWFNDASRYERDVIWNADWRV